MEKNHDFDLKLPISPRRLHLVQIRNPIEAIASWKAMEERGGMRQEPHQWREWLREKTRYWMRFMNKWVYSPVPNRLVVDYDRMLAFPFITYRSIIEFMTDDEVVDTILLTHILKSRKIQARPKSNKPYLQP